MLKTPVLKHPFLLPCLAFAGLIRNLRQQFARLALTLLGDLRQQVHQAVVPAALLLGSGEDVAQRTPQPEVAVPDHQARFIHPQRLQIAQQAAPRRRRPAVAAGHRQHRLVAVRFHSDGHQQRRLLLLQTRFQVHAVQPQVHDLVLDPALLPLAVLRLPAFFRPCHRARRQRRLLAQQPAQRQLEVAARQAMQIQLRQQIPHLLGAPREQRQQSALEPFVQVSQPRPAHRYGPAPHRQPARLPVAVAIALHIHAAAWMLGAPQELGHLLDQQLLHPLLDASSGPLLQFVPHRR